MCTHTRMITNAYTGKMIRVNCGKCEACQQEKANRNASRIRHQSNRDGYMNLFITLTYRNDKIPYIRKSHLRALVTKPCLDGSSTGFYEVPVLRDCAPHFIYNRYTRSSTYLLERGLNVLGSFSYGNKNTYYELETTLSLLKPLTTRKGIYDNDKVGVLWFDDIQNFFKRLRINLKRSSNDEIPIKFFQVGEYGPSNARPHFHALIQCSYKHEQAVRRAVNKSWTFGDYDPSTNSSRHGVKIEIAKNAAEYVAGYVNCHSSLPLFLTTKGIAPKKSMSLHYGWDDMRFSVSKILEHFRTRNLRYITLVRETDGSYSPRAVRLPQYIIRSFAPKIKGYCRLTSNEILDVYANPFNLSRYADRLDYGLHDIKNEAGDVIGQYDDLVLNQRKIHKGFERFSEFYPDAVVVSKDDYARFVLDMHKLEFSENMKSMHEDCTFSILERYDNPDDILRIYGSRTDVDFMENDLSWIWNLNTNPNCYSWRVSQDTELRRKFQDHQKHAHINSSCISFCVDDESDLPSN